MSTVSKDNSTISPYSFLSFLSLILGIIIDYVPPDFPILSRFPSLPIVLYSISVILFFAGTLEKNIKLFEKLNTSIGNIIGLTLLKKEIQKSEIGEKLIQNNYSELNSMYVNWICERHNSLLETVKSGCIVAQDPDYFGFAEMIFSTTSNSVISTSKVDPLWYDNYRCSEYIKFQKDELLDKGKKYTRIFFVSKDDTEEKRKKILNIVKKQSDLGFKIIVTPTDSYINELDVAIIDSGKLIMEAKVESVDNKPIAEINGCYCYINSNIIPQDIINKLKVIKGYIESLPKRNGAIVIEPSDYNEKIVRDCLF